MSGPAPVAAGGAPTAAEAAALGAALAALLEAEGAAAARDGDALPAAYRSAWRRAALLDAVRPPTRPDHGRAGGGP